MAAVGEVEGWVEPAVEEVSCPYNRRQALLDPEDLQLGSLLAAEVELVASAAVGGGVDAAVVAASAVGVALEPVDEHEPRLLATVPNGKPGALAVEPKL